MKVIVAVLMLAFVLGCTTQENGRTPAAEPQGTVIARVENSVLTLEELLASIPDEYRDVVTHEQNVRYVRQWIDTELLFHEALRLGIDREAEIKARLEKMRRDLLSAEVINRFGGNVSVSDEDIREYYELHRSSYTRENFTIRYDAILVDDLEVAWMIRRTATHETFRDLAMQHSKMPVAEMNGGAPYVPIDQIPANLRTFLMQANVPSITGPYRSPEGFYVLRTLGKFERGSIASLDEMRGEIVAHLTNAAQQNEIAKLIDEVRSRSNVETHMDRLPQSSGANAQTQTVDTTAAAEVQD